MKDTKGLRDITLNPTMNSQTLQFTCLTTLAAFTKSLNGGYYSNIVSLTVKGKFSDDKLKEAIERFGASLSFQVN